MLQKQWGMGLGEVYDLPQINDGQALIRPTVKDNSHSIKNNTHRFNTRFNVGMNECVKERKVAVRTSFDRDQGQAKPVCD